MPMQLGEMVFDDLTVIEIPVKIGDQRFILREASEDAAVQYRNACSRCARMEDGKLTGIDGIGDVEPLLVSLCLFQSIAGPGGQPLPGGNVDLRVIRSWKAKIVKELFNKAKEISDLSETDETKEGLEKQLGDIQKKLAALAKREQKLKNSQSAMTANSV